jgi:hypothetical protein
MISGTEKYKGEKDEWMSNTITAGKPIVRGTSQLCYRVVGWIEFAK